MLFYSYLRLCSQCVKNSGFLHGAKVCPFPSVPPVPFLKVWGRSPSERRFGVTDGKFLKFISSLVHFWQWVCLSPVFTLVDSFFDSAEGVHGRLSLKYTTMCSDCCHVWYYIAQNFTIISCCGMPQTLLDCLDKHVPVFCSQLFHLLNLFSVGS